MTSAFGRFLAATTQRAPFFDNDLEVLNYALTLEHLEAEFYKMVVGGGQLQGKALTYLTIIRDHEVTHVTALTQAIQAAGGTPVKARRSYNFAALGDMNTQAGILAISETLEMTGVGAYNGAAPELNSKAILAVAGSIVAVEARHTAIVRVLLNPDGNPVPRSFAPVIPPQEVLNTVGPLLGPEA